MSYVVGERIYLRPMNRTDLGSPYQDWINDAENTAFTVAGAWPWSDGQLEEYWEANQSRTQLWLAASLLKNRALVGTARIYDIGWIHGVANRGVLVGKEFWGLGYATEIIGLLSVIAFDRLGLHKLRAHSVVANQGIIKVNERCGYVREGLGREEFCRNGQLYDVIHWGLLAREWRT